MKVRAASAAHHSTSFNKGRWRAISHGLNVLQGAIEKWRRKNCEEMWRISLLYARQRNRPLKSIWYYAASTLQEGGGETMVDDQMNRMVLDGYLSLSIYLAFCPFALCPFALLLFSIFCFCYLSYLLHLLPFILLLLCCYLLLLFFLYQPGRGA